jgi:hypothetical protein
MIGDIPGNRNHRLNIQDPLRRIVGTNTEIKVVLVAFQEF